MVLYHMLVFTPFASEPIARTCLGYSCAIILSIHLLVHVFSILRTNLSFVKFKLQLCYARSKLQDEVTGHPALMEQRRKRKNKLGGVNSKLKLNNFDKFENYDHDLEAAIQNVLVPVVEVRNSRKKKQKQAINPLEALVEVDEALEKDQSPDMLIAKKRIRASRNAKVDKTAEGMKPDITDLESVHDEHDAKCRDSCREWKITAQVVEPSYRDWKSNTNETAMASKPIEAKITSTNRRNDGENLIAIKNSKQVKFGGAPDLSGLLDAEINLEREFMRPNDLSEKRKPAALSNRVEMPASRKFEQMDDFGLSKHSPQPTALQTGKRAEQAKSTNQND